MVGFQELLQYHFSRGVRCQLLGISMFRTWGKCMVCRKKQHRKGRGRANPVCPTCFLRNPKILHKLLKELDTK
jgi:hypothetical protein